MRMLFIIFGALIVLGGGAAGAYFYFVNPAEASKSEEMDEYAGDEKAEYAKSFEFVELDPLILPIVDAKGVSQTVSLVVVLEVPNSAAKTKILDIEPRLKDAYIQDMYGVLNKHAALKGGVLQVDMLKSRLNKISQRIVGEDKINDVLLQVVQQRPI